MYLVLESLHHRVGSYDPVMHENKATMQLAEEGLALA